MKKYNEFVEKLFWLMIIINPFLDAATGIYKTFFEKEDTSFSLSPSLIIRFLFLSLLVIYLFTTKNRKAILTLIPIGIAAVASVGVEIVLNMDFSIMEDAMYIARFAYNIVMLFCWYWIFSVLGYKKKELLNKLNRLLCWTLIIIGINVIFGQITGTGHSTYADRFGYRGSMGYYFAGNDITAILMLVFPVSIYAFINSDKSSKKDRNLFLIASSMTVVTNSLIGTKTSFLALFATSAVVIIYGIVMLAKNKESLYLKKFGVIILAAVIMTAAIIGLEFILAKSSFMETISESIKSTGNILRKEGIETALLSGRQVKLKEALTQFKDAGPLAWIFGIGRGSQESIIEMDVVEVLCYYGIFGILSMLWIYVSLGFMLVKNFLKNFSFETMMVVTAIVLCTGYMLIAGHILFSVTSGYYFTMMFAYADLLYSKDVQNLPERIPFPFKRLLTDKKVS